MKTCAVIPAAGRGSRLNTDTPKILLPLTPTKTIWSVVRQKLVGCVDHIHVIVSPQGERLIRTALLPDIDSGLVSLSVQARPIGMGDAIFQGYSVWSRAEKIVVVWGDQAFVSSKTIKRSLQRHGGCTNTVALPLTLVENPYVEYIFDTNAGLTQIKQSREGDVCAKNGLADVGTFVLSVHDLLPAWNAYVKRAVHGSRTDEINFLPFLLFLAVNGWRIKSVMVSNPLEARGINTPDDLRFFQQLYERISA